MKRLLSIFFLAVLLFNFYGYSLMISYMESEQQEGMTSRLDKKQYKEDELISIKTPLNLPYYTSSPEFERAYGSLNVNGVEYEYVQRRVYQDTLELLCLPNKDKMDLQSAKIEILKSAVEGQPLQSDKKAPHITKISLPEFCQEFPSIMSNVLSKNNQSYFSSNTSLFISGYTSRQERPPQSMLFFI